MDLRNQDRYQEKTKTKIKKMPCDLSSYAALSYG